MTNMEKVAEMLGVEIGEEFNVETLHCNPYKFTDEGLTDYNGDIESMVLGYLLHGKLKIEKIEPEQKITIVTQVCGYCGDETNVGFTQIIKDTEIHMICDECLEEKYGVRL